MIVSTGTRASLEPIPGLAEAQPLTHIEALELGQVPEHLLVIGSGYVGVELSQAIRRFGSKVTVVDGNGRLMSVAFLCWASHATHSTVGEKVRRENALDFGGCNSRPGTGSLHPMAIEVGCFSVTKSTVF
jgi:NADPH-dependent 2,4-dienoyl-CoA reductase/sulfur reductase-like enzyme